MLTKEYLDTVFYYKDGNLYKHSNHKKVGSVCGSGYVYISLNKKRYLAHRIIFCILNGYLPKYIDHINGNKSDNRIENLREATLSENQRNTSKRLTNKSGYKNICWEKGRLKWRVDIRLGDGKYKVIGRFEKISDAVVAAVNARKIYHGNFANHGI